MISTEHYGLFHATAFVGNTLPFIARQLAIDGLLMITPRRFADNRGYFAETYNRLPLSEIGIASHFVQDNEAHSATAGTLRGLHFQRAPDPQAKLVRVIAGSIFDVAVDLRRGSPTHGRWCGANLTAAGGEQIFVPVGFAHAYCTLEPQTLVAYEVDGYYNKVAEGGIRWDDPDVAVEWPVATHEVMVSDKDRELPLLRDIVSPFSLST